ncbi:MAG: hypothetical protein J7500_07955 [Sphingomonas sp.]|uniref:hypothetical protein n=1 Tax=Sphingomonas sp. TaxID=28214 RepID=UPI001B1E7E7D|nr:hypothetical protein [Sphingomonas sp.]MBO9622631.1 hypothetical protein [Sphingomonas sp.]
MIRILPSFVAALVACTPSPQETAMRSPRQDRGAIPESTIQSQRAAVATSPEAVSAAENLLPTRPADSAAETLGRRILSTAFVRVGPDGHLTVELHNGRALVLRDVVMRRKDYCGVQVSGGKAGARYCGGYAEVVAARPGGRSAAPEPDLAAPNPLPSPSRPVRRN